MTAKNRPADQIDDGAWSACWGRFTVRIWKQEDVWKGIVWETWSLPSASDTNIELEHGQDFPSALIAARWAVTVLEAQGAKAFVDGRRVGLESFLLFSPVPALETA